MLKSSLYFAYQFELKTHDICFFASPLSCQCCIPLGSYSCNMKTSTLNRGNVSHRKRAKMHITGWSNDHAVILSQTCFFFLKKILVRSCVLYKSRKQQCSLGVYAPQMHKRPAFSFINNFFLIGRFWYCKDAIRIKFWHVAANMLPILSRAASLQAIIFQLGSEGTL